MSCQGCVITLLEFIKHENIIHWLEVHGVLLTERDCPECGNKCQIDNEGRFQCGKVLSLNNKRKTKRCRFSITRRSETWFSRSNLSIELICQITVLWLCASPPRTQFISDELCVNLRTVEDWSSYCRETCVKWCFSKREKLGGEGVIVEIDEPNIDKRISKRGQSDDSKWIFGGIERESKKLFLVSVPDRKKETLLTIIKDWIHPDSTIVSDSWNSYAFLKDLGFKHLSVQSLHLIDQDTEAHTQTIKRVWRDMWASVPRFERCDDHYDGYLCEFMWKRQFPNHTHRIHEFFAMISHLYNPQAQSDVQMPMNANCL